MPMAMKIAPRYCVDCRQVKSWRAFPGAVPRCAACLGSRACPGCGETKPIDQFGPIREGEMPRCLACRAAPPLSAPEKPQVSEVTRRRREARARIEDRPNSSTAPWSPSKYRESPKRRAVAQRVLAALGAEETDGIDTDEVWRRVGFWTRDTIGEALDEGVRLGYVWQEGPAFWRGNAAPR